MRLITALTGLSKVLAVSLIGISGSYAQTPYPGCPNVNPYPTDGNLTFSGDSVYLECGQDCVDLLADYLETGETDTYKVNSIAYAPPFPFNQGNPVIVGQDDVFSGVINLPFDFCFYDNSYNSIVVSANGLVSFDIALAGDFCAWDVQDPIPSPPPTFVGPNIAANQISSGIYNLSINGVYHDVDPTICGKIYQSVFGTFPCRTFVVNWDNLCHFDCGANRHSTTQIVLYETTNVIEVYVKEKETCDGWNGGRAVIGIQNNGGTVGLTPPGRNTGKWSTQNEAWRFTPDGAPNYVFEWLDKNGVVIGSNKPLNYCLGGANPEEVTAAIKYTNCNGDEVFEEKTLVIVPKVDITATVATTDVLCADSCNGTALVTATTGSAPFKIIRADGSEVNGLFLDSLCSGSENITVEEGTGCTVDLVINITEPDPITTVVVATKNSCGTAPDGTLEITAISGGTAPYTILWPDAESDSTFYGAPGTYSFLVTDANGCEMEFEGTIPPGDDLALVIDASPVSCFGGTDGTAFVVSISGGIPPYTVAWNTGSPDSTIHVGAGTYTCTITVAGGCFVEQSIVVTEPPELLVDTNLTHLSCPESMDGVIELLASGGTSPYSYSLNGGPFGPSGTFSDQAAGPFTAILKDKNNCETSISGELTADSVSVKAPDDVVLCQGEGVVITATGYFTVINWDWGIINGEEYFPNHLGDKQVKVTVENANGCEAVDSMMITVNPVYDPTIVPAGPFCSVDPDVTLVTADPNGIWSGAVSSTGGFSPGGEGQGTHEVIYTFPDPCTQADTIYIDVNDNFDAFIDPVAPFCILAGEKTLTSNTNGGKWFGQGIADENFPTFDPVLAGEGVHWVFHLIDNTCGDYDSTQIEVIRADTAKIKPIDPMCWDGDEVQFEATPEGGTWSGTKIALDGSFNPFLAGSGGYEATYTPEGTCIIIDIENFTVGDTMILVPDTFYLDCFSDTNGIVTTGVSGGYDQNYTYNWQGNVDNADNSAFNLAGGTYTISVTDGIGCTETSTNEVIAPPGMTYTQADDVTNPLCPTSCDGTVQIYVTGGEVTSGYTYTIESGQGVHDGGGSFSGICSGLTVFRIADDNGCYLLDSVMMSSPSSMTIYESIQTAHCGLADGQIKIDSVVGGTPGYTFSWSNGGTGDTQTGLLSGNYTVNVSDGNSCPASKGVYVPDAAPPTVSTTMNPVTCFGGSDGQLTAHPLGGGESYQFAWSNGAVDSVANNLSAGTYSVVVSDQFGCQASSSAPVTEPTKVVMSPLNNVLLCVGQSTTLSLAATGGNGAPYSYSSDQGQVMGSDLTSNYEGVHTLVAYDQFGCASDPITFEISFRDPITLSITPPDTICPGFTKNLMVVANGGTGNFSYLWETGESGAEIIYQTILDGIRDSVSVVASDGCSPDETIATWIDFVPPLILDVSVDPNEGCEPLAVDFALNNLGVAEVKWDFGNGAPLANGLLASNVYFEAGNFFPIVSTISSEGCPQKDSLDMVAVYPTPYGEIEVLPGQLDVVFNVADIHLNSQDSLIIANWSLISALGDSVFPGNTLGFNYDFPDVPMVWEIWNDMVSEHGCINHVETAIKVHPRSNIFVPSAFTPDGDGVNDYFSIKFVGLETIGFAVYIFDRWGEIVFTSKDPNFKWDGKVKEKDPKIDFYGWTIQYYETEDVRKELNGSVQILK